MGRTEGLTFISQFKTLAKDAKHLRDMNILEHKIDEKNPEISER